MTQLLFGNSDSAITVNVDSVVSNWRYMDHLSLPRTKTAAMVKADGYGLGSVAIATALANAGCKLFFVASLQEAINLRKRLSSDKYKCISIIVLHGIQKGQEKDFIKYQIIPTLNNLDQISRWQNFANKTEKKLSGLIHFDTGMSRLGLDNDQSRWLIRNKQAIDRLNISYIMTVSYTHLTLPTILLV